MSVGISDPVLRCYSIIEAHCLASYFSFKYCDPSSPTYSVCEETCKNNIQTL